MKAADIFNIKLMKCGGLYRGSQICTLAENFGITCMVGCMLDSEIARRRAEPGGFPEKYYGG